MQNIDQPATAPATLHSRARANSRASEAQLLEAWRSGDLRSGAELSCRHYDDLLCFFARRVGARDSEDLAQATVLACIESLENFRWEASIRGLLFAIAKYKLGHYYRACERASRPVGPELLPHAPPSPGAALQELDERRRLHSAIARLPADRRALLQAHYWQSIRLKDIATAQGVKVNTLKSRIRRVREHLAQEIR